MKPDQARGLLAECCGSSRWANEMVARRPFRSRAAVYEAADRTGDSLEPKDWLEAFEHHPRIGDTAGNAAEESMGTEWAAGEQSGMKRAGDEVRTSLIAVNEEYERRFGYIYIVCASGKSAEEMLELARKRLGNDPEKELRVAVSEQRKITRLRLDKLLETEKGAKR